MSVERIGSPLSRLSFKSAVFERDHQTCLFCDRPAQDAHHILERRLWSDGGYHLDNGASVCAEHHLDCERTLIPVEAVRQACGITKPILPSHLYRDQPYDKWGNPVMPNGTRLKGELFWDESVQKVLGEAGVLSLFTDRVKYPRTYHLPWSEGMNPDDRMLSSMDNFIGRRVIVTKKMDGENTTLYRDGLHARSVDSAGGAERDWVKRFAGSISHDIPEGWRVCGENLYELHSIAYADLPSFFLGFSVWTERNLCLCWNDTLEWFALLGILPVEVLYDDIYDEQRIKSLFMEARDWETVEGYVLRVADAFPYGQFRECVGKFVRRDHLHTVQHGRKRFLVSNALATGMQA